MQLDTKLVVAKRQISISDFFGFPDKTLKSFKKCNYNSIYFIRIQSTSVYMKVIISINMIHVHSVHRWTRTCLPASEKGTIFLAPNFSPPSSSLHKSQLGFVLNLCGNANNCIDSLNVFLWHQWLWFLFCFFVCRYLQAMAETLKWCIVFLVPGGFLQSCGGRELGTGCVSWMNCWAPLAEMGVVPQAPKLSGRYGKKGIPNV